MATHSSILAWIEDPMDRGAWCLVGYSPWGPKVLDMTEATQQYLFIFGCTGSSLVHGLFSSCGHWGSSLVAVHGLLIAVAALVGVHRLQGVRASVVCNSWAQQLGLTDSGTQTQHLCMGLVALWHVGLSQVRDQTHVSFIGKCILYH